jgi:hypothetical protein
VLPGPAKPFFPALQLKNTVASRFKVKKKEIFLNYTGLLSYGNSYNLRKILTKIVLLFVCIYSHIQAFTSTIPFTDSFTATDFQLSETATFEESDRSDGHLATLATGTGIKHGPGQLATYQYFSRASRNIAIKKKSHLYHVSTNRFRRKIAPTYGKVPAMIFGFPRTLK